MFWVFDCLLTTKRGEKNGNVFSQTWFEELHLSMRSATHSRGVHVEVSALGIHFRFIGVSSVTVKRFLNSIGCNHKMHLHKGLIRMWKNIHFCNAEKCENGVNKFDCGHSNDLRILKCGPVQNYYVAIEVQTMTNPNLLSVVSPILFAQIQSIPCLNLMSELTSLKIGLRGQTFELRPIAVSPILISKYTLSPK